MPTGPYRLTSITGLVIDAVTLMREYIVSMKREALSQSHMSAGVYLANAISKVTNPCVLSIVVLILIAYAESSGVGTLFGWFTIIFLFLVVLPLIYVYHRTRAGRGEIKLLANPTAFLRRHPKDIFILGTISGLPCILVLVLLKAPTPLISTLVLLLTVSLVVALFNLFYKASYHLAAVTILIGMAVPVWWPTSTALLPALPVIGWAKYRLGEHTPTELASGFGLALIVGSCAWRLLN